ncbi:hypothetical protein [Roseovarius sp. MMSF_3281]|uniref:putative antirestriction adenine methyltransferase n=1 Tax=Roseovarius sp. MMSF_3281 TaxID=3046694 RepID=UPI003531D4F9
MFLGVVPTECIQQIFKVIDFTKERDVHICCSGTFRLERALQALAPQVKVHSNDVSLFSCVMGGLATGAPIEFTFTGELAGKEKLLEKADPVTRAAAVMVAFEMARYARRNNAYNVKHFDYYDRNFLHYVDRTVPKITRTLEAMEVNSFFPGDWLKHAHSAIERDAMILAFPPFAKGGYEAQFKFLNENVEWDEPAYGLWDPKDLREETRKLERAGARYCMLTDQYWDDHKAVLKFAAGRRLPHYCYAKTKASSFIHKRGRADAFRYKPVDPEKLTAKSKVEILLADGAKMNFIKDVYLAKSITHVSGMVNFLILIDDMLVGSVIYDEGPKTRLAYGDHTVLILSDLAIINEGKLSKFVAMLATSRALVRAMELKLLKRYDQVVTTAFSRNPSSMKYRGVLKKLSRRENDAGDGYVIQYGGPVSDRTPQQLYQDWWKKHGPKKG